MAESTPETDSAEEPVLPVSDTTQSISVLVCLDGYSAKQSKSCSPIWDKHKMSPPLYNIDNPRDCRIKKNLTEYAL